ncbi:GNAT family N-acetyltransferase [Acholeplasma hippikon]|uniref:Spermine/spermidine acetyltransferase n=1 Tax=Acholeplasma hippikon TaxID=264636 RepID=A0A449BJR1_9MOLU|nr:GNAT family N-acetyltransferase [Acholeplasma hippikon]VEU82706.1 Spermine/spermidine acetyltransferase [Acholeplasma hippikon]
MEYIEIDKKHPPLEVLNLTLKDNQKAYLDPLPVMLKEYENKDQWKAFSIHLDDECHTTIGFAISGRHGNHNTWIEDLMIDKNYQGKGYGTEAIKHLITFLVDTYHIKHVYLSCCSTNTYAFNIYSKLGFKKTNRVNEYNEDILVYTVK